MARAGKQKYSQPHAPVVNVKRAHGKISVYQKEYHPQYATSFCLLGATNEDLAQRFEISVGELKLWMQRHPEFLTAIREGREWADENVAKSLYRSAIGYSHPETKVFYDSDLKEIVTQQITKHYPPNNVSIIFWLKNRQRDRWKDRREETEDGSNMTVIVKGGLPPMDAPDDLPSLPEDQPQDLVAPKQPKLDKKKRQLVAAGQPIDEDEA